MNETLAPQARSPDGRELFLNSGPRLMAVDVQHAEGSLSCVADERRLNREAL